MKTTLLTISILLLQFNLFAQPCNCVLTQGSFSAPLPFMSTSSSAVNFYAYGVPSGSSSNTGLEMSETLVVMLHEDTNTGNTSLIILLDLAPDGSGGDVDLTVNCLPDSAAVALADDGGELFGSPPTITGDFVWATCCTDGGVISGVGCGNTVTINPTINSGINTFSLVYGTPGNPTYLNMPDIQCPITINCGGATCCDNAFDFSAVTQDPSCENSTNGSIDLETDCATTPTFQWSNGAFTEDINGLSSGTYTVTITDINGCAQTSSYTLTPGSSPQPSITGPTAFCAGDVVSLGVNGAYSSYFWSTGSSGSSIPVSLPGSYSVTVTDAAGCTGTDALTISQNPVPVDDVYGSYCENEGGYYYPGDGQSYPEGNYTVTFFDASYLGCDSIVELHVTELYNTDGYQEVAICAGDSYDVCGIPYDFENSYQIDCNPNYAGCDSTIFLDLYVLEPVAYVEPPGVIGCGINASVYLDGFSSFADSYLWETADGDICDNDPTSLFLEVCQPGTYCLTATSTHIFANGNPDFSCTDVFCVTVTENAEAPMTSVVSNDVACPGDVDGDATITVSNGGIGPFGYDWDPSVSFTNFADNLPAGDYNVTITSTVTGCTTVEVITIGTPAAISITTSQNDIACNGGTTGDATATPSGGTAPFTYSWCNSQTTQTATGLPTGACQVIVTDANGCTNSVTVTIIEASALVLSISPTNVACNGGNTGSATASTSGGTGPYTYVWSNSQSGATATNLTAGSWMVTVTDDAGCTSIESVTLNEPGAVSVTTTQTDVLCNGDNNGTATATPSGGIGTFTYSWCNSQTTATATGLTTGPCAVVVTDGNGCTATTTVTIVAPDPVTVSAVQGNVSCNGGTDGTATATPGGGAGSYSYMWCNGQTSPTATGLGAGACSVVVTDGNGCTVSTSVTLTEPAALSLSTTQQDVACNGDNTGSATVTPTGGTGPYSYQWCNGGSNATVNGLSVGTCSVIVTDASSCTETISVTIAEATELQVSVSGNNVLCNGGTGDATATPSGGTGPYTYLWCDNSVNQTATGLSAGNCVVVVTDANGCTETGSVLLTEPNELVLSATGTDVSCTTSVDGEGSASATGGVAPLVYTWCNSQTGPDATGLGVGPCEVIVTDANGCTTSTEITIAAPDALTLGVSFEDVSCFGASNGTATVTASGGTGTNYAYDWCNGQGTATATGLDVGTCSVIVTDDNGCTETISVTLSQPAAALSITGTSQDAACGNNDGSISVSVTGGTTPYSYEWNNGNQTDNPTNLGPGGYTVTVTDNNDCTEVFTINVDTPSGLSAAAVSTDVSCNAGSDGTVSVTVMGGVGPYDYDWDSPLITSGSTTGNDLPADDYSVTVTDDSGCTYVTSITVTEPLAMTIDGNSTDETCGETNGTININVQGGTGPYDYLWTPGNITDQNPTNIGAGNYSVVVTDANDCTATYDIMVSTPNALVLSSTFIDAACNGATDGSIDLTIAGGVAPFDYDWSGGTIQDVEDPGNLGAGTYTVVVTDDTDCSVTTTVDISEPEVLSMVPTSNEATCGEANGSISIVVSGGVDPYEYVWSGGNNSTTDNPTGLVPGDYFVTITDANDCELIQSVEVTEPAALQLGISSTMTACFGGSDGEIDLTVTGGVGPYAYDWGGVSILEDPVNLLAGSYTVIVTDDNGCTETTSIMVGQPTQMEVSGSSTDATCGDDNGSISVSTTGGTGPYTYSWSPSGDPVSNPADLGPGTYTTIATDANGCTATYSIDVNTPTGLTLVPSSTDELCFGESIGTASVEVQGGVGPFTYSWSNSSGPIVGDTSELSGLVADTYQVIVTDATGCTIVTSATVSEPLAIVLDGTIVEATCGDANGGISLTVAGGTAPFTYLWSNASADQNPTGLLAGDYDVEVTDANGCTATYQTTVTTPAELTAIATQTDVSCNGGADGSIDLTTTGGTAPFDYLWTNADIAEDPTGLSAGMISGVVTDANGCQAEVVLTLTEPEAIAIDDSSVDASCGDANGSIDLTVTGGVAPYTYLWSNASIDEDPTGLLAGNYTVVVTDLNGCTAEYATAVSTPNALALAATPTDVACNGASTGSIELEVSGGVGPFSYLWVETGWTGEDLVDEVAGSYNVVVTDATGCSITLSEVIGEPTAMSISGTTTDALCGQNNGTIDITVVGGTPPYSYDWGGGITDEDPTNLGIGNYTVIVTDGNMCTAESSLTVNTPNGLALDPQSSDASCNGGSDGTASVTVSGGTAPFTYVWTVAGDTDMIIGLPAGSYTVTVTDDDGCEVVSTAIINEPDAIAINGNATQETCDDSNGSITISVNGGTEPYSYEWLSGGSPIPGPDNLTDGDYTVVVTDLNGCTAEELFTVTEPAALTGGLNPTDVSCNGGSDGSIGAVIFGGLGPYNYAWSPAGGTGSVAADLPAADYSVLVTDANGCTITLQQTVGEPAAIAITGTSLDATCGDSNGSISVVVTGGTAPYQYAWSPNGAPVPNPTNLGAGGYTLIVTDNNDCTAEYAIDVNTPTMLQASAVSTDALCAGSLDGTVDVTVQGGTAPFTYVWSNLETGEDLPAVGAGSYTVLVTDANGCTVTTTAAIVGEPTPIDLTATSANAICGLNNGSIDITVTGGTPPYTYSWSNGTTGEDPGDLGAGIYIVTVTDANDCTFTSSQEVITPNGVTITPQPFAASCNGDADGGINLTLSGGVPPFTFEWSNGETTEDVGGLLAGSYTVTVTDADNCETEVTAVVDEPDLLQVGLLVPNNIECNGDTDGGISLDVTGGTGSYTYAWSNGSQSDELSGVGAGTYTVTVTDNNGCTATLTETLTEPEAIVLSATPSSTACSNTADGSIDLTVAGGMEPYSYGWSNGSTDEDPSGLSSGLYIVVVTDANGCTESTTMEVDAPQAVAVSISAVSDYNGVNVSCNDSSDGSATAVATGGVAPFSYSWTNGATGATTNDLAAGTYTVLATDANGCTSETPVTLVAPDAIFAGTVIQDLSCFGQTDGAIIIDSTDGGAQPFMYSLDGGDFNQFGLFGNLSQGNYELTIQDANGCEVKTDQSIGGPTEVIVHLTATKEEVQLGDSSLLAVQLINIDTSTAQQLQWTQGAFWMDVFCDTCHRRWIYPMETTRFEYLAVDENGCIGRSELILEVRKDRDVFIPNVFSPNGDGNNDIFYINASIEVQSIRYFKIYNRWGEVVFEQTNFFANDPNAGWDGRFKGDFLNPGVFVYHASILYKDGRIELKKGDVTIMR